MIKVISPAINAAHPGLHFSESGTALQTVMRVTTIEIKTQKIYASLSLWVNQHSQQFSFSSNYAML